MANVNKQTSDDGLRGSFARVGHKRPENCDNIYIYIIERERDGGMRG